MKKLDILIFFLITILLITSSFFILNYFESRKNECINNPFVFGAKEMEKKYDVEVYGVIHLLTDDLTTKAPNIYFTSTNYTIE